MSKPLLVLTDSGHGGLIKNPAGKMVYDTGNKKRYKHVDDTEAFEGIINRLIEDEVIRLLDADGRAWVDVSSGNLDLPLKIRVDLANDIYLHYKDKYDVFYLSFHSNAGKGSGIEVFTSIGESLSDVYASFLIEELQIEFPEFKFRMDNSDGDKDKEANFYVLRKTLMPSVLLEFLFFDNYQDWQYLQDKNVIQRCAYAVYKSLIISEKSI